MANPLCIYFGKCGGCSLQHIGYAIQLDNKKKSLEHATGLKDIKVFSADEYHYRNRMDMIFHKAGLGLRQKGKWYNLIDIEECSISNDRLNNLIKEIRGFFISNDYFDINKNTGTFRYAVIRTPKNDSSISFVLNSESKRLTEAVEKIKEFSTKTNANNIIITYVPHNTQESISNDYFVVNGKDVIRETYLNKEFLFSVQGFFQNNTIMAEKMHEYVHKLLSSYNTKQAHLLDLYGGVGTFGIINSALFKNITIIEDSKQCIDAADLNIKNNNINNAKAIILDAKNLKKIDFPKPLFVITDPPRSGMHPKTIEQLKKLKPEVIIYISCNITQLKKDILKFKDYRLNSAAMFDLFPQTNHSESIVELVRSDF